MRPMAITSGRGGKEKPAAVSNRLSSNGSANVKHFACRANGGELVYTPRLRQRISRRRRCRYHRDNTKRSRSTPMPYAENKGTKIFYDTYGQGTPIVFLHPWTTNGYIWYYQVFPFALTNQVIVIDHRGHGRSDKPQSGY